MENAIVQKKIGNSSVVIVPPKITDEERQKRLKAIKRVAAQLLISKEVSQCKRSSSE